MIKTRRVLKVFIDKLDDQYEGEFGEGIKPMELPGAIDSNYNSTFINTER